MSHQLRALQRRVALQGFSFDLGNEYDKEAWVFLTVITQKATSL